MHQLCLWAGSAADTLPQASATRGALQPSEAELLLSFPTPAACTHVVASLALLLLQKSNRYFRHFAAAAELHQTASHIGEVKEHGQGGSASGGAGAVSLGWLPC